MKRIFSFIILILMVLGVSAQGVSSFTGTTTNPNGAILNATVDTLSMTMSGNYNAVMTVHVLVTRSSGTLAGTVRLYGSNYNNTAGAWQAVSDTLTMTNAATNEKVWTISQPAFKYYQILQSGGTTMAGILTAKALGIKPN